MTANNGTLCYKEPDGSLTPVPLGVEPSPETVNASDQFINVFLAASIVNALTACFIIVCLILVECIYFGHTTVATGFRQMSEENGAIGSGNLASLNLIKSNIGRLGCLACLLFIA